MAAQISSLYIVVTETITMMVQDDVHWSKRRILFSVSFDYEGLLPG